MGLSRKKAPTGEDVSNENGEATFEGSTWGRAFEGSFAIDGPVRVPNPSYMADAVAFEQKLGALAFTRGQGAAEAVAAKAVSYMQQRAAIESELGAAGKSLDTLYEACGYASAGWAGAVGKAPKKVEEALTQGNIRERLTAVQGFVENILVNDVINAGDQAATLMELMKKAEFYTGSLEAYQASGSKDMYESPFHKPQEAEGNEAGNVDVNRANRSDLGLDNGDQRTDLTTQTVTTPLSERELAHQGLDGDPEQAQRLHWLEGAKKILLNEEDQWVKLWRDLSVPLKGGPSGHTYKFMQANQILGAGAKPDEMRLACLGYLLPINAHSMIEVLTAASTFGASSFPNDETVYRYVEPLSQDELRDCGKDRRFPDEGAEGDIQRTAELTTPVDKSSVPVASVQGGENDTGASDV